MMISLLHVLCPNVELLIDAHEHGIDRLFDNADKLLLRLDVVLRWHELVMH